MPYLKKEEMAEHFWSQPLQKFRITVTETVTRIHEIETDNRFTVEMLARQIDANRHSTPRRIEVVERNIEIESLDQ